MASRGTPDDQLQDTKRGVAVLMTCLVQEIEARHPGFKDGYLARLGKAYGAVREDNTDALDRLELINWTREFLTGFSPITGQAQPFLDGQ